MENRAGQTSKIVNYAAVRANDSAAHGASVTLAEGGGGALRESHVAVLKSFAVDGAAARSNGEQPPYKWSELQPYLKISSTFPGDLGYTSKRGIGDPTCPFWPLRVPFVARECDDVITLKVIDANVILRDELVLTLNFSMNQLISEGVAARAAGHDVVEVHGTVGVSRFTAYFEYEEWAGEYVSVEREGSNVTLATESDLFLKLLVTAVARASLEANAAKSKRALAIRPIQPPSGGVGVRLVLDDVVEILDTDDDSPYSIISGLFFGFLRVISLQQPSTSFTSRAAAERYMSKLLASIRCEIIAPEGEWDDASSDDTTARYLLCGNGSPFVHKTSDGYECRLGHLNKYQVRDSFQRYGATGYFGTDGQLTKIEMQDLDGRVFHRGEKGWEWAKLALRTAAFIGAAAIRHGQMHYLWGNVPNVAIRKFLSQSHPIRRLLHPHFFRSALAALDSTDTVLPPGGLMHRWSGFSYDGLVAMLKDSHATFKFVGFEQEMEARGFAPDATDEHFSVVGDAMALHAVICEYVSGYVALHYTDEDSVHADKEVVGMWGYMKPLMDGLPPLSLPNLKRVLTEIIFRVSGYNQHISNCNIAGTSPVMIATHLKRDELLASIESSTMLAVNTALTAGMLSDSAASVASLTLLADWSFLLVSDQEIKVYHRFGIALRHLAEEVEEKNAKRKWALNDFNPRFIPCSVCG